MTRDAFFSKLQSTFKHIKKMTGIPAYEFDKTIGAGVPVCEFWDKIIEIAVYRNDKVAVVFKDDEDGFNVYIGGRTIVLGQYLRQNMNILSDPLISIHEEDGKSVYGSVWNYMASLKE